MRSEAPFPACAVSGKDRPDTAFHAFQVGDVVYKASGVFRIAEIGVPDFMREKRLRYFTLKDVYARNPREALYVPTGSAGLMRPVAAGSRPRRT